MFATVIVPLDGSAHAEVALAYGVGEARRHDARLVLMRVIPFPEPWVRLDSHGGPAPLPMAWPPTELAAAKRQATAYLHEVRRRYGLGGDVSLVVAVGEPAKQLLAEVRRRPTPLLVLTTGETAPHHQLSDVVHELLTAGTVPVLGVRPQATDEGMEFRSISTHRRHLPPIGVEGRDEMTDDEQAFQEHEVIGEEVASCDVCGRPVPRALLVPIAGKAALAEPVEELHVCETCRMAIEQEELPFEEEIGAGLQDVEE
jgi:nucleotide-binding universal stress UspA family protein